MGENSNRIIQDYTGFLCFVFCFGMVSSLAVCIDNSDPDAPDGLEVSGDVGGILLEWGAAVDLPSCSGIDYYIVSRDGEILGEVFGIGDLVFVDRDSLGEGEYAYTVYAVDLVGKNAGASVKNVVRVSSGGGSSGGGSDSGFVCGVDWVCGEWGECVPQRDDSGEPDGEMRRECRDLNNCGTPYLQPGNWASCEVKERGMMEVVEPEVVEDDGFFSLMTGAVVGVAGTPAGKASGALVLLVLFGFVAVRIRRGNI